MGEIGTCICQLQIDTCQEHLPVTEQQQCVLLHHVIYHTKLSRGNGGTYTTAVAGGPFKHSGSGYLFYM